MERSLIYLDVMKISEEDLARISIRIRDRKPTELANYQMKLAGEEKIRFLPQVSLEYYPNASWPKYLIFIGASIIEVVEYRSVDFIIREG